MRKVSHELPVFSLMQGAQLPGCVWAQEQCAGVRSGKDEGLGKAGKGFSMKWEGRGNRHDSRTLWKLRIWKLIPLRPSAPPAFRIKVWSSCHHSFTPLVRGWADQWFMLQRRSSEPQAFSVATKAAAL